MPRAKKPSLTPPSEAEAIGRLADSIGSVERELRVLREVLDEIREDLEVALRQGRLRGSPHVVHVTHVPHPAAPPPIDAASAPVSESLPSPRMPSDTQGKRQKTLFESDE